MKRLRHFAALVLLVGCSNTVIGTEEDVTYEHDVAPIEHDVDTMTEAEACEAQSKAYQRHGLTIGCPTTIHTCPDYMRVAHGDECLLYDASSVLSCIEAYRATRTCDELYDSDVCRAIPIEDSAPDGCD